MTDTVCLGCSAPGERANGVAANVVPPARVQGEISVAAMIAALGPPIDNVRVDALRSAIAEGRYTVDPDAIAARMLSTRFSIKAR